MYKTTKVQIATAGEALMDMIEQKDSGYFAPLQGGAVFNLTRALARQGLGVLYLNPLSNDRFGRAFQNALQNDHVHLAHSQAIAAPTSLAMVQIRADGGAEYAFYREGVADRAVTSSAMNAACDAQADLQVVATGCLALAADDSEKYLPWLQAQKAQGKTIVVDANLRPQVMPDLNAYRANIRAALHLADIVKASDEDMQNLGLDASDPLLAAQNLLEELDAHTMLVTLGAEGAYVLQKDAAGKIQQHFGKEREALAIKDTVGAGDCFLAGYLVAWLENPEDTQGALLRAIASASLNIMEVGCVPPSREQVLARVQNQSR